MNNDYPISLVLLVLTVVTVVSITALIFIAARDHESRRREVVNSTECRSGHILVYVDRPLVGQVLACVPGSFVEEAETKTP
jgi:hypothetical protein